MGWLGGCLVVLCGLVDLVGVLAWLVWFVWFVWVVRFELVSLFGRLVGWRCEFCRVVARAKVGRAGLYV